MGTETHKTELIERAKAGDVAAQFDLIAQHAQENSTSPALKPGLRTIELVQTKRRLLPEVDRQMALVDAGLMALFRKLVSGQEPWPLFLHGPSGGGKTLASLCLCDIADTATYATVEELADLTMRGEPAAVDHRWQAIATKRLAVLDELGCRSRIPDLHYSVTKKFADERELRAGRVSIFISNVKPKIIQDLYDDRIAGRVLCGTRFELDAKNRRATG